MPLEALPEEGKKSMANVINAEAAPVEIADALRTAAQDLRQIKDDNDRMRAEFESAGWSGLDRLEHAGSKIDAAYDALLVLGDKFHLADEVRQAYLVNEMVGDKHTVTETGKN